MKSGETIRRARSFLMSLEVMQNSCVFHLQLVKLGAQTEKGEARKVGYL